MSVGSRQDGQDPSSFPYSPHVRFLCTRVNIFVGTGSHRSVLVEAKESELVKFLRSRSMLSRRVLKAIVMIALLMPASLLVAVQPASADTFACPYYLVQGCDRGWANWFSSGDRLEICDDWADGWSIVVIASVDGGNTWVKKWNSSGAGTCVDRSFGNLPEGRKIVFDVCIGHRSTDEVPWESCGYQYTDYA
jgi:hypothetical protein